MYARPFYYVKICAPEAVFRDTRARVCLNPRVFQPGALEQSLLGKIGFYLTIFFFFILHKTEQILFRYIVL